ncbi:Serine/threonine protein kinase [Streptomyces sp. cf124]|uniref:serine/threonine-protein kinase n=1 Tax=Streptomyces sp. cf124 TaxID=1761903 RepID=UPI0008F42E6C|nr:serine/threonine-protein kinase [Streptomyces sp. cf124]SFM73197.1 Serine/threonine protein kinase [Streptomyces sp. cf124]
MQTTPLSPEDPAQIGGFELLGRIGQGGMGQVYLGESPGGEPAAVKIIKPSVVDSTARLRFAQEIEILKTVWGARIAQLLDADAEAEQPWLATEYVEGPDLGKHVVTHGPLPALLVLSLGATLAEGLGYVHKQGLLHRDLKPANILLGPNGPKIIDFGLAVFAESSASLTAANTVVGTPSCMPPEQANGVKPLTSAVDVYALGTVLLFAATGHLPYHANNIHVLFHMVTDPATAPDLTGVPPELAPLLTAMLSHQAQDRPTITEVVQQCRGSVEAQGLKLAQARRRLTTYTAAPPQDFPTLLSAPVPEDATLPAPDPAVSDPATTPRKDEPATLPMVVDGPASDTQPTMHLVAPQQAVRAEAPVHPAPTAPVAPNAEDQQRPQNEQDVPLRPRPTGRPPARSLRHSAQARRTAQQLREAYAARAAF